jgi:hypothetical protein
VLLDPQGRTLLVRNPNGDGALFSRMWQFPAVETNGAEPAMALDHHLQERYGVRLSAGHRPLKAARHSVTFRSINLQPYLVPIARLPQIGGAQVIPLTQIRRLPISNATQKIAKAAIKRKTPS